MWKIYGKAGTAPHDAHTGSTEQLACRNYFNVLLGFTDPEGKLFRCATKRLSFVYGHMLDSNGSDHPFPQSTYTCPLS